MRTTWRRILGDGLVTVGLLIAFAGVFGVATTRADGGKGEIKIHLEADCQDENTNPKVGDVFWVGGHSFDLGVQYYLTVTAGMQFDDPHVIDTVAVTLDANGDFCMGGASGYSLPAGHYKAYVSHWEQPDGVLNHEKTKVFWVLGPEDTVPPTDPPDTTVPDTTVPETNPPDTDPPGTDSTTTSVASEGPTTTAVDSGGPTTTAATMPVTGGHSSGVLYAGLAMVGAGLTLRGLARRTS